MRVEDIEQCYYQPGKPGIIDYVHPNTGKSAIGGKSLEEIRLEYPGAEVGNFSEVVDQQDAYWITDPQEITEERWYEMLEVLPPVRWEAGDGYETFMLSERTSGNITAIFCRIGERRFEFQGSVFMPLSGILGKCEPLAN